MPWGQSPANIDFRKNKINTTVQPGPAWFHSKPQRTRIEYKPLIFNWITLKDLEGKDFQFPPTQAWTSDLFKK